MDKTKRWISSIPYDAMPSFKEFCDIAKDKVYSSVRELSCMHEKVEHCQEEMNELNASIRNSRDKMAKIESMTENPRVFAIASMYHENIACVFMGIKQRNEMFEELKKTIHRWDEKRSVFEEKVIQWGNVATERSQEKLIDILCSSKTFENNFELVYMRT